MIKLAISVTVILVILSTSCSKNNSSNAQVTCLINDTAYSFTSSSIMKDTSSSSIYWLHAIDNNKNEISLESPYPNIDSLYSYGTPPSRAYIKNIHYNDLGNGNPLHAIVVISNVHNGQADGTFTAFLFQVSPQINHTITITNGVFKDVPVHQ